MRKLKMFAVNDDEVRKIRLKLIEILLIIGGIIGGIELKSEINWISIPFVLFLIFAIYYYVLVSNKLVEERILFAIYPLFVAICFSIIVIIPFFRNIDNVIKFTLVSLELLILSMFIFLALYQDFSEDKNMKVSTTPKEKRMNSNENESNFDKCPLSVENWIMLLNDEIKSQIYPNFTTMISPIMILSISLIGFMISSIGNSTQELFTSIWHQIWIVLIVLSAIAVVYYIIDFYKTHTKIEKLTMIRNDVLSGILTDSNQIHEEWKNLGNYSNYKLHNT